MCGDVSPSESLSRSSNRAQRQGRRRFRGHAQSPPKRRAPRASDAQSSDRCKIFRPSVEGQQVCPECRALKGMHCSLFDESTVLGFCSPFKGFPWYLRFLEPDLGNTGSLQTRVQRHSWHSCCQASTPMHDDCRWLVLYFTCWRGTVTVATSNQQKPAQASLS